ncbi:hypothetical protein LH464_24205 [Neorhizobium sp. T786]|uniref:DUF7674 family protein n=1 Tax=Pseudorhizobium xiangyangii TaxID=2883104 RepID=UPI001CFF772D|nr:hypothetical protein [Neorhizobium xiangyangii]MCB5205543.1 hypothetical protein [Neorhizobium xiangyangii]
MSALTVSFSCHLAFVFRELIPVLGEHIKDNSGEILPHIIMSEYCRFSLRFGPGCEWVEKLFSYMESEYSEEDNDISELVAVSFIEIIPYIASEPHWSVKLLGPKMLKQYNNIYGL